MIETPGSVLPPCCSRTRAVAPVGVADRDMTRAPPPFNLKKNKNAASLLDQLDPITSLLNCTMADFPETTVHGQSLEIASTSTTGTLHHHEVWYGMVIEVGSQK